MKNYFTYLFLLITFCLNAQITIKGKVVDEFNNPLPFVNILVKGTTYGTTTDDDGKFAFISKKKRGTLEISFIGFKTQNIKLKPKIKFFNITLKEGSDVLNEVLVVSRPKKRLKKKENPAYKILKEIWKRKRKNGLKLVDAYQYKKHTTIEVGLNNLDTVFIKTLFKEQYKETLKQIKYDSDGINYYIPIFMNEKITNVYGNNKLNKEREDTEAEKENGLGAQGFVFDRMSNTFKNIDVFKNDIVFLRKSFVSPLSSDGFATYDYVLYDSITKNNQKLYNIYYFPIRKNDLAFKGNFWVSDHNFSIKKIRMKVTKSANLNFVRGLTFEKEFETKNDSIYIPSKNSYEGDFTFFDKSENNKGLTIKKNETYDNYLLNKKRPSSFYEIKKVKIRPDQYEKDSTYWSKVDDPENIKTYKIIKAVKGKRKIKKLTGLINTIASGYVRIPGNIQLGPLWTAFSYNEIEGFKTNIGFRTFKTKDDRFNLKGRIAYAFKDERIKKYSFEGRYLLSYAPRITTGFAIQSDVEQLGSSLLSTSQLTGTTFGSISLFSRGKNFFLSSVKKLGTNFDYAINPNLHLGFNFSKSSIKSASKPEYFSIDYLNTNGDIKSKVVDVASRMYLSFTPGRNVYGLGVTQRYGVNVHPTLVLVYKHGYKNIFGGTHNYDRLQLRYSQPIMLGKFGMLDTTIEGGKTFGIVPLTLLNPIPANQSYSLVRNTFALINYYDFITDTYAASHIEHHFNGFILNRIPLLKKLNLRSLVTFRTAYGTISDKNKAINRSNIVYNAPSNKLYYEYGFGLENIGYGNFRFFRVDAIWRSNYKSTNNSNADATPKFAIRIAVKPGL